MESFLNRMKSFKEALKQFSPAYQFEIRKGLRDERTGLPKDWAGNVIDREYLKNQIKRVKNKIPNEINKEEKERLILELEYWEKYLSDFDKEHGTNNNNRDAR